MSVENLPTDIDVTYPDRSPGDAAHQQHHDTVHGAVKSADAKLSGLSAPTVQQAVDNATQGLVFQFRPESFGAAGDGTTDDGAAIQAALDGAAATDWPSEVSFDPRKVYRVDTGIVVPAGTTVDGRHARIVNDASQTAGNHLFRIVDVSDVVLRNLRVDAVATGDFTGGRNPQVAVSLAGVVSNITLEHLDLRDHQTFAIQYADPGTDPALAVYENVSVDHVRISGDCGPEGDGSGLIFYCRSEESPGVPAARGLHIGTVTIDVTRGETDRTEHGPQCMKIQNVRGVTGTAWQVRGGSVGTVTLTGGAQEVEVASIVSRRARRGLQIHGGEGGAGPSGSLTRGVNVGFYSHVSDGVTGLGGTEDGLRISEVEDASVAGFRIEGDLRIHHTGTAKTMRRVRVGPGVVHGDLVIENGAAAAAATDLYLDGVEFVGGDNAARSRQASTPRTGLWLPGVSGNYVSTPDHADLSITGDIDLRVFVRPASWRPSSNVIVFSKLGGGGQRSWRFGWTGSGLLALWLSDDGTAQTSASSSTGMPDEGPARWVRGTWRQSDGRVQFFTSFDGDTWTQLGSDRTIGIVSIYDGTTDLSLGALDGTTGLDEMTLYAGQVYDGIGGALVADWRADVPTVRQRDSAGRLWTVNGLGCGWQVA